MEAIDIYSTPETELIDEGTSDEQELFYVVSMKKFWILSLATFNLYSIYWFYKHWANYKEQTGQKLSPVLRAIFAVFFTHSLFNTIDREAQDKPNYKAWFPKGLATIYIILVILERIYEKSTSIAFSFPVAMGIFVFSIVIFPLISSRAQQTANIACGDISGDSNSRLTPANFVWILLGIAYWVSVFSVVI